MKKRALSGLLMFIFALVTIAGCKSSGGDTTHIQPTTATLNIMSQGTLTTGQQIGAVEVTVNLPSGVTVQATPDSTNNNVLVMNPGVVVGSGVLAGMNIFNLSVYTAATSTEPGKVKVNLAKADGTGFGVGEFVTVNCDVAAGVFPKADDFNLTGFTAYDLSSSPAGTSVGAVITGLTFGFTAQIQ